MGLKSTLELASGDSTVNGFTREQVQQLLMAEQNGAPNTVCKEHKEWGQTLMNYCWNREARGEDISCIYLTADHLQKFPKNEDGTLFDEYQVINHCVRCYQLGKSPIDPDNARAEDGTIDMCMLMFLQAKYEMLCSGSNLLWSGRVSMSNVSMWDGDVIMGEGIQRAKDIVSQLQSWSANNQSKALSDPLGAMNERAWSMMNILLGLDDMNIRGYQLIYAMEFCDNSVEKLYEVLGRNRSQELCDYVNMKSAKDYLAGDKSHNQVAVTGGASFCYDGNVRGPLWGQEIKLTMDYSDATAYVAKECSKLSVDYSKLDIINEVDFESAIRICEARGFRFLRMVNRKGKHADNLTWLGMYNPDTKDYIVAPSCEQRNVCYGGVELTIHRTFPAGSSAYRGWEVSRGGHDDQDGMYFEFTHNEGLFKHYEESLPFVPEVDYDWSKIGFDFHGIPIPKYFEMPFLTDADLFSMCSPRAAGALRNMGAWCFEKIINAFMCLYDEELKNSISPHYVLYEDWFYKNALTKLAGRYTAYDNSVPVIELAVAYLKVPDDIMNKLNAGAAEYFKMRDARINETNRGGRISDEYGKFQELLQSGTSDRDLIDEVVRVYGLPDPADLPIKMPWL